MYNLATTFMQNNEARRGEWGIKKYLLPNGSRPLLTSCSYRQTVEVISRDAEKNNKKASGKMEDEGKGKEKGRRKVEKRRRGLRLRRRRRRYISRRRREDLVTGKLVIRLFNEIISLLMTGALGRVAADFSETVLIKMHNVSRRDNASRIIMCRTIPVSDSLTKQFATLRCTPKV